MGSIVKLETYWRLPVSYLNVYKHVIDLVNLFGDRFNEQTHAYFVRVITDLVQLLVSCFAHVGVVVCFLAL